MKLPESEFQQLARNLGEAIRHPLDRKTRNPRGFVKPKAGSEHEERFDLQLRSHGVTAFERQFRIHPDRRFMADFYFPKAQLVVEIDGGNWVEGRHGRGNGMDSDAEKSAYIARMPARLIRLTPKWVKNGQGVGWVLQALGITVELI